MNGRRALIIVHEPAGTSALVGEGLSRRGFEVIEHLVTADIDRPDEAAPFPETDDYDVLVVMGSIRSLTATGEISSWIHDEIDLVRAAHERRIPVLGVCFGGQVLAHALGGKVKRAPGAEIGWYEISGTDNPVGPGPWFQWHHDSFTPPSAATVLAVNDNAVQLFRLGRSLGIQFHPEVTVSHLEGFLSEASADYLDTLGVTAEGLLADMHHHAEANTEQCADLVDWFLDEVAGSG